MGGSSWGDVCPRCGEHTLMMCSDTRPVNVVSGECLQCGFEIATHFGILPKDDLEYRRNDFEYKVKKLNLMKLQQIEDFDRNYFTEEGHSWEYLSEEEREAVAFYRAIFMESEPPQPNELEHILHIFGGMKK